MKLGYPILTGILFIIAVVFLSIGIVYDPDTDPIIWILFAGFTASTIVSLGISMIGDG